jgi:hypothetical protein
MEYKHLESSAPETYDKVEVTKAWSSVPASGIANSFFIYIHL